MTFAEGISSTVFGCAGSTPWLASSGAVRAIDGSAGRKPNSIARCCCGSVARAGALVHEPLQPGLDATREHNHGAARRAHDPPRDAAEIRQVQTSSPWLNGMISACATSDEYASFQSHRAGYSPGPAGRILQS